MSKSFFERKSVGMSYLSDSILVLVDCSKLDKQRHEDLFMNSRDRLSDGPLKAEIERQLEDIIKNHQGLRSLREKRRREDIENKLQDSRPLAEVLENIINKSPALSSLFIKGVSIKNPFKLSDTSVEHKFEGKRFPTFFRLAREYPPDRAKSIPINSKRFRIQFETDADNKYFDRDQDPGAFNLEFNGSAMLDYSLNLWKGLATLNIQLPRNAKEGDVLLFKTEVTDITRSEPFNGDFHIKVVQPQKQHKGSNGYRKDPPSDERGFERQKPTSLALPNALEVRANEWDKYEFNDRSALKVVDAGDDAGYDFYINMDNVYLQMEIKENSKIEPKLLEARFKYGMVLIGISLLDFEQRHKNDQSSDEGQSIYDKISQVSSAISPTLLPMITSLSELALEAGEDA